MYLSPVILQLFRHHLVIAATNPPLGTTSQYALTCGREKVFYLQTTLHQHANHPQLEQDALNQTL
jgi:hypothetical protein